MNFLFRLTIIAFFASAAFSNLFARWVVQDEIRLAATSTLAKPLFQRIFPNATIEKIVDLDGLWCVQLEPKGYLIFSGSTKQMPLLKYAFDEYSPPEKENPDLKIQMGMRNHAMALEAPAKASFAVTSGKPTLAESQWAALLTPQNATKKLAATEELVIEEEETLPDEVDLTLGGWDTNWSQWVPWNDFCPQISLESETADVYRNRAPVGCAATMYTQIMKYYEWQQRIDAIYSKELTALNSASHTNGESPAYEMRFHGGLPFEWSKLKNDYWVLNDEGFSPTFTSEAERLPVARLGFLIDVLSDMAFDTVDNGGSGTSLLKTCINDWYDFGEFGFKEADEAFTEEQLCQIKEVLAEGMPLPASIPDHAVFICGYQDDGSQTFLKMNYGYANSKNDDGTDSNRFYLADESQLVLWSLGHCPKVQVQIAPFPKVVNTNALPALKWMVPEFHIDEFAGFTISATPYSSNLTTTYNPSTAELEDLTADTEVFSIVTLSDETGDEINALALSSNAHENSVYAFPDAFIPTKETTFSCNITDLTDEGEKVSTFVHLQLWNEADMCWETLLTFPEKDEDNQVKLPSEVSIPLADYAERFCRLRITFSSADEEDESEGEEDGETEEEEENVKMCYALSHIAISNVYAQGETRKWTAKSDARAFQLSDLTTNYGTRYRIQVVPETLEEPGYFAETFTRLTDEPVLMPLIKNVTNVTGESLKDDLLLIGDLDGRSGLRVYCNEAVSDVRALASCPTLVSDDDITVFRYDEHIFDVVIDSRQVVEKLDGSRMIITLEARTSQGNVVYRDITFALKAAQKPIVYVEPTIIERAVDGDPLEIPAYWFYKYGLADREASAEELELLADEDADKDGMLNWHEFLCETSPIDAADKLQINDLVFSSDGVLKDVIYTPASIADGVIHLEGKVSLTDLTWEPADFSSHHFFRLRVKLK